MATDATFLLDLTAEEFADIIREAVMDCNDVDGVDWKTAAKIIAEEIDLSLRRR